MVLEPRDRMLQPNLSQTRSTKHRGSRIVASQHFLLRRCESCGDNTLDGPLCHDCADRAHPHHDGDPYDDIGGSEA